MKYEKKFKKYFADHPEVLDKVLAGLDKYTSIEKEDIPTFDEVYGDVIKVYQKDNKNKEIKVEQKKRPLFLKKAFYVPVGICLVLGIFIATPTGQAFAKNIYHTVIQWTDSGVNIYHGENDEPVETDALSTNYYKTVEDVRSAANEKIAWNIDNSILGDITLEYNGSEQRIITKYSAATTGSEIIITQTICDGDTEWGVSIPSNDGKPIDVTLNDEIHFVGYAGSDCYAVAYQDNMSIEVFSENLDYDSFVAFIKGIRVD